MKTILVDAVDGLIVEENDRFQVFEEMHKLLESFPNRKILLTGANDEQLKKFGLDQAPYEVFTLKHSPEKTDPEYFKTMLAHFDLTPEQVAYFEHKEEAAESARSVGIPTFYYDPDARDLGALKGFLTENV